MDPYKILGVNPNSTDEQIKQAYRTLAKKYHPDNYVNNPIADLAAEKMAEINAAYDKIMESRNGKESGYATRPESSQHGDPTFAAIRNHISYGNLEQAEQMLMNITNRNAEWYFLMGSIYYRRGWLDQARDCFRQASQMDPANPEYATALNRMHQSREVYRSRGFEGGGMSACDCCSTLLCADCCCECMGGDLIPCC